LSEAPSRRPSLDRIRRAAKVVELRMRLDRVIRAAPVVLTIAFAAAAVTLVIRKTLPNVLAEPRARQILIAVAVSAVAALIASALRRLPPRAGAIALDRHHELRGRLTNALSFAATPETDRSPLMEVAIDDACEHAKALAPSKAAPLRLPRDLAVPFGVALGVVAIAMLEVRLPARSVPQAKTIDALQMSPDDLELFKQAAKDLERADQSPEVKAAIERFNQLIEDIANKRLERTEAFRQMEAIERELLKGAEADAKALQEALEETGRELKKSDLAKPLGESLEKKDLDKAKQDLKDLAAKLRDKKKPDKAALERLRDALKKASERRKEALAAINEKRAEAREELLKRKQKEQPDGGAPNPEEDRLLKKKERELERLDREAEKQERTQRQLDRLDRELAKAAEDLMKDLGMSAEDMEQAAEDINRLQEEEMSDKEKEELRKRLEEMREVLRQQGQGGKQRMARMMRFGKRARGGQSGDEGEQGEKGEGQQQGQGQEGQEGQQGQGKGDGGQQWVIGPGGKKILVPGSGATPGQGQGQGQPKDGKGNGGDGNQPGGQGIGTGHSGDVAGKRTDPKMDTSDVQAQGLDSGQGPSNSEVILSAAERGFKGTPYKKVYKDYRSVAEEQINKDQIPDGYRFYVQRYFQLIRPRE
jgi:hypothetical protein